MFLATFDVLGPVARVRVLIVEQSADAQLFGGRAVPTRPIPRARSLVTEYAVQPVTVVAGYRAVCEIRTDVKYTVFGRKVQYGTQERGSQGRDLIDRVPGRPKDCKMLYNARVAQKVRQYRLD